MVVYILCTSFLRTKKTQEARFMRQQSQLLIESSLWKGNAYLFRQPNKITDHPQASTRAFASILRLVGLHPQIKCHIIHSLASTDGGGGINHGTISHQHHDNSGTRSLPAGTNSTLKSKLFQRFCVVSFVATTGDTDSSTANTALRDAWHVCASP